jgi:hypothetical protein
MTNETLDLFGKWALLAALPPALFFVISYMLRAPWWRSLIGVMFVLLSATIIGLISIVSLSLFLGLDYPGRFQLRAVVYALVAITMYFLAFTYETERRSPTPVLPQRKDRSMSASKAPLVTRAPGDVARKVLAFLIAGVSSTFLIGLAASIGFPLDPTIAAGIVAALGTLSGYLTRDRELAA